MRRYKPDPFYFPCLTALLSAIIFFLAACILLASCVRVVQAETITTPQPVPITPAARSGYRYLGLTWVEGHRDYIQPKAPRETREMPWVICDPTGTYCRETLVGWCIPGSDIDGDGDDDLCAKSLPRPQVRP